ncbi:hypothetical protein Tco_0138362 [Tanacetum coccineum]
MVFPRLQELAVMKNSNHLTDAIRIHEHRLLIAELNVFVGPLALQCAKFLKQLSQTEVLKMLEIRKTIAEVHIQVHKKIDFLTVMRFYRLVMRLSLDFNKKFYNSLGSAPNCCSVVRQDSGVVIVL